MDDSIKKGIAALGRHSEKLGHLKAERELGANGKRPTDADLERATALMHQEREDLLASIRTYAESIAQSRFEAGVEMGRSEAAARKRRRA